jgi:hypothetical protein
MGQTSLYNKRCSHVVTTTKIANFTQKYPRQGGGMSTSLRYGVEEVEIRLVPGVALFRGSSHNLPSPQQQGDITR